MTLTDGSSSLSKIKDLTPGVSWDVSFQRYKNVMRYQGSHILSLRRPSRTPAFSRKYVKGDPVHLIDWKSFARTDQLLIREQRDEASARIAICLDIGDTMVWPDIRTNEAIGRQLPSKLEIAVRLLLNIAYIHLNLGDTVKVYLWTQAGSLLPQYAVPLTSTSDVVKLYRIEEDHHFSLSSLTHESRMAGPNPPRGDLAYWLSDGINPRDLTWLFEQFPLTRYLQVLSSLETDVSWVADEHCYFDEGLEKKEYLGSVLRYGKSYYQRLSDWQAGMKKMFFEHGGGYQTVTEETPIATFHNDLLIYP